VSHQVVLLYAQSGAGKTSLVNAGISTALAEKNVRLLPVARIGIPVPKETPLANIANVYAYNAIGSLLPDSDEPWRCKAVIGEAIKRLPQNRDECGEPELRVFILDQFEELFTIYPERWQDRKRFYEQVAEALRDHRELRALFVLREDFLAAFDEFVDSLPESGRTRYRLDRLRKTEALLAIKKPLEGTSRSFDAGVAETMVRDLMAITIASPSGEAVSVPGEFVEPVQLQVVCFTLLERLPAAGNVITMEAYRRFGDPDEALESFYQKALEAAISTTSVDEAVLREWFEEQLITPSGTRGLVFQGHDRTGGISNVVIEVLEQRHLIRPEVRSGSRWYELTHDRFIRPILKSNRDWAATRWSQSIEAYTDAIHLAVNRTSVLEANLREFLDSLIGPTGALHVRSPQGVSDDALSVLVKVGFLRLESGGGDSRYSPMNHAIARTIQIGNQNWRAANSSQAVLLRRLESRAEEWAAENADRRRLLLARSELQEANAILSATRVSGFGLSEQLLGFVEASRQAEWAVKLRWIWWAVALFTGLIAVSFLVPPTLALRWQLLYYGVAGIGAAYTVSRHQGDDGLLSRNFFRFMLVPLIGAASGMAVLLLPYRIPPILSAVIAIVAGFFGTVLLLEATRSADEISDSQYS
jgi:hypothetical protein